jgi:hypothetical protein
MVLEFLPGFGLTGLEVGAAKIDRFRSELARRGR